MFKAAALALIVVGAGATWASAEEVIVKEKERPAVTLPIPGVSVEKRERVETVGRGGCDSKTVRKEGPDGDKTITKERCD